MKKDPFVLTNFPLSSFYSFSSTFQFFAINRTSHFLMELIIEGTTEKASQIMPLKSIYNKKVSFKGQKMHFWTLQKG
jgi:hypothetical protein